MALHGWMDDTILLKLCFLKSAQKFALGWDMQPKNGALEDRLMTFTVRHPISLFDHVLLK